MNHKRVVITRTGPPDVLQVVEDTSAEPAENEARVRVQTAGVAFADISARTGTYPGAPQIPFSPGYDIVGVVDALGADVAGLTVGQTVAAMLPRFGGYTEAINLPADWLVSVPDGLDPVEAVALVLNYTTAYRILHHSAKAQSGERALIHSAAGGVGTALLQLGKAAGLELYGTASKAKHALISELGATPIDYQNEDFAARVRELTGDGVDVVCDPVAGQTMRRSYGLLRRGGRLISYGFLSLQDAGPLAVPATFAWLALYTLLPDGKRAAFYGNTPSLVKQDNAAYRAILAKLFEMLAQGSIKPVIGATFPLAQAAKAHEQIEQGAIQGKAVLLCDGKTG